jgi:Septum formation
MAEQWACARCSTENPSWAITCSNCGMLRPDLSVAPPPSQAPADAQPAAPVTATTTVAPVPDATPAAQPATSPASANTPMRSPSPAASGVAAAVGSGVPAANATLATTTPRPAPAPTARRLPIRLILIGAFLLVPIVAGAISNASRSGSGEINKSGDLNASDLRAGDCFDLKDKNANQIGDVHAVPCTSEHQYETFFTGSMPAGTFPTESAMDDWISGNCEPAYETYVGTAYQDSHLEVYILTPSSDAWNNGDRSVQCSVYDPNHERLTQSLKDAAR